jgi:hypothetical protein
VALSQEAFRLPTSISTQFSNLEKNEPNDVLFRNENVKWSPDLEYIAAIGRVVTTGVRKCRRLLTVIAVGGEACVRRLRGGI